MTVCVCEDVPLLPGLAVSGRGWGKRGREREGGKDRERERTGEERVRAGGGY